VLCVEIIYLNLYFLGPKLLFRNKYGQYFLSVFLIITALFLLLILAISHFSPEFAPFIKSDRKFIKIYFHDVLFIEGLKDYVITHTAERKAITLLISLKSIQSRLPENIFVRVSKSYHCQYKACFLFR
jgi:DNA-binding LytR/AlgR family response regulator